jgi:DNA-binding GntR family transcriptional regulator
VFEIYEKYHRRIAWADEIIQAGFAHGEEADILGMKNLPLQQQIIYTRDRISYDQENLPLEVLQSTERGDFFKSYRYRIVAES